MKIETFIKNEAKKYRNKVITNKNKGVNLDKLECLAKKHEENCIEFINRNIPFEEYSKRCHYESLARKAIQEVDDREFGCFNNQGQCIGYNFYY